MTSVIQHYSALGTTTSRTIYDVNGNDYYFYVSRRDLMLETGYFSSLHAHFCLLIVTFINKYRQRIMLQKHFKFQTLKTTMIMWSGYSNKFFI